MNMFANPQLCNLRPEPLSDRALQDWIAYSLTPMSLLHLFAKHRIVVGADAEAPFAELNAFWRQQIPQVDTAVLERVRRWLSDDDAHSVICQASPYFPALLNEIHSPPRLLYCAGDTQRLVQPLLAVVGSRRASPYALAQVDSIVAGLCREGWGICSGMAMGIDAAAHRSALHAGGVTVAVLGSGIDVCYPPRQRQLYHEIKQHGLLVSEFYPGAPARSDHFLRRNRIISGLSQGVIVAEATLHSGSLATANFAVEQNRNLYALPGPVSMGSFAGNHKLIQQGAGLITCAEDILAELPMLKSSAELEVYAADTDINTNANTAMSERPGSQRQGHEKPLANPEMLANVGFETTSIDSLVTQTRLPVAAVMNQLIELELDGWVTAVPGGYVRVRRE